MILNILDNSENKDYTKPIQKVFYFNKTGFIIIKGLRKY